MCDFRSRKRLHESDPYMDSSLSALSRGMEEPGSLFHHGEVGMSNSSSMLSPELCATSMEVTLPAFDKTLSRCSPLSLYIV